MHVQKGLRLIFVACLLSCFHSCTTIERDEKKFIKNYGSADFTIYKNKCVFIRGKSRGGEPIIFVSDINDSLNGPIVLTYDKAQKKIVNFGTQLRRASKLIDTLQIKNLAEDFMKYSIGFIKVDSMDNVYIGMRPNDGPSILRPFNFNFLDTQRKQGLLNLKNGWWRLSKEYSFY
jgi:hypothetical protein